MNKSDVIYVAGHTGLVGSALLSELSDSGFNNIVYRTSAQLDLRNYNAVQQFFEETKPKYVFLAAAKVGGIFANNTKRAEFLFDNLQIQTNVIHQSYLSNVNKLLFLGSSCIYPKKAELPISEDQLLTGPLEPTNEPYAIAKIAGIKMCEAYRDQYGCNFISAMPTNLYGLNDNYDLTSSHVLPALIKKIITAKYNKAPSVEIWGTGKARREFLNVSDLARALILLMKKYNKRSIINIGSGKEISILELAQMIKEIVGYQGEIKHDLTKPDGVLSKTLDISKISSIGWQPQIPLNKGISEIIETINNTDFFRLKKTT